MKRRNFLQSLMWLPLTGIAMKTTGEITAAGREAENEPMPVLFVGHGSPVNAIEENTFSLGWRRAGMEIPRPRAILCISAHWETRGTSVTAMEQPRTIHDFHGFPDELYAVSYPAPGSRELALETKGQPGKYPVSEDLTWGFDHGCWSILKHMFPAADIPVLQLSLDYSLGPAEHHMLARQLAPLRRKGFLIIGSGNIVHNLRMIDWRSPSGAHPWAMEAEHLIRKAITEENISGLCSYEGMGKEVRMAVPTPEHFLPVLYALALKEKDEQVSFFNDQLVYGSVSMTSFLIKDNQSIKR